MNKKNTTRDLVVTALLVAMSVIIPMTFPQIPLPQPFSATLASHVPLIVAMFISPWSALAVVIGSAIGFFARLGIVVSMRAASHIIFATTGCFMIRKRCNVLSIAFVTMIFHALSEAVIIFAFGNTLYFAAYVTGIGTLVHHAVDFTVAVAVSVPLAKAKAIPLLPRIW